MRRRSIALIATIVIVVATATAVLFLFQSPPTLEIELNSPLPLRVKQEGNVSLEISVRNGPGFFKAQAKHIQGELELPEGFIEESLQTRTRQLIFGTISPEDASHYGLTIIGLSTVEVGEYHAKLTVWGANMPRRVNDIEITVLPP